MRDINAVALDGVSEADRQVVLRVLNSAVKTIGSCLWDRPAGRIGTLDQEAKGSAFRLPSRRGSIGGREACPAVVFLLEFIDHGDGVVREADLAVAGFVCDELVAA